MKHPKGGVNLWQNTVDEGSTLEELYIYGKQSGASHNAPVLMS